MINEGVYFSFNKVWLDGYYLHNEKDLIYSSIDENGQICNEIESIYGTVNGMTQKKDDVIAENFGYPSATGIINF